MTIDCRRWNVPATLLLVAAALCIAGCHAEPETGRGGTAEAKPSGVAATAPAVFWMTSRMLNDRIPATLECQDEPGDNVWTPAAGSIRRMQQADVVFLAGAGEEGWLQGVTIPERRLVDLSAIVQGELIPLESEQAHQHGPGGAKSGMEWHGGVFWDPSLLNRQALEIRNRLLALYPDFKADIDAGYSEVTGELSALAKSMHDSRPSGARMKWLDPAGKFNYLIRAAGGSVDSAASRELAKFLEAVGKQGETPSLTEGWKSLAAENVLVLLPSASRFDLAATRLMEEGLNVFRLESGNHRVDPRQFLEQYRDDINNLVSKMNSLSK